MTIPSTINYPSAIDSDDNLFLVHDSLRVRLAQDYHPGDTTIYVEGDPVVFRRFPQTGLITLTEQCSDPEHRAISFYYSAIDYVNFTIGNLEILDEFVEKDSLKLKKITHVTQNVMDRHHNAIKDAAIAIERFIGVKGTTDKKPLGETMEGRINFLRKLVLSPKAYFTSDKVVGLVPLTVTFKDLSFRLGTDGTTGPISYMWNFGDNSSSDISFSTITASNIVTPSCIENVSVDDIDGGSIIKTYCVPGIYDVMLTVTNKFGTDTMVFPEMIHARIEAPKEAIIEFIPDASTQAVTSGGYYISQSFVPPVIRSPIDTVITMKIPPGVNPDNPDYSYAGELLDDTDQPIDPIQTYTWSLDDDVTHPSTSLTRASYSMGGMYDLVLRADTRNGAYRITKYPNSIDIVEKYNIWMFNFVSDNRIVAYEYGLISETYKTQSGPAVSITRDESFLTGLNNSSQMLSEFRRNVGFAPRSNISSGDGGNCLLFYAGGRDSASSPAMEKINFLQYNAFSGIWDSTLTGISRPWNWANFNSSSIAYFLFGEPTSSPAPNTSPVNPVMTQYGIATSTSANLTLGSLNFSNGANELLSNVAQFDNDGNNVYGNFSVYRTAWKSGHGYILRNDNIGDFFRIRSFYRSEGTLGSPVQTIKKLGDMPGPSKQEGELLALTPGLYFFNNTGSISAYDDTAGTWETTGPGTSSLAFRTLQDPSVSNYDDPSNSLVAVSDGDQRAYLSYDYSTKAFLKFSALDLTFVSLGNRPPGTQFAMGMY